MHPEVMAFAMQFVKGKVAVEIGGASGENAILLAFAGAEKVYMNDREPLEIDQFQKLQRSLPADVRDKLIAVEGSCFELLSKHAQLSNQVDLVLCRNVIHFFNPQEQADFFDLLKTILKPGGKAIFTVNSKYGEPNRSFKETLEENPSATSFQTTRCAIYDLERGQGFPTHTIYQQLLPCSEEVMSSHFTSLRLYERGPETSYKWKVFQENFQQIDASIQPEIKKAIQSSKNEMQSIRDCIVKCLINYYRIYSTENLQALCESHGLLVDSTFVIDGSGHVVDEANVSEQGLFAGAIITRP
ncbi:MAG: class I SAM-dependent methyltransferase [Verrucomicrobia bacterium]|nr:class I SAM-dependent methyltransferase [Verrucomicrobiota bacterium]